MVSDTSFNYQCYKNIYGSEHSQLDQNNTFNGNMIHQSDGK